MTKPIFEKNISIDEAARAVTVGLPKRGGKQAVSMVKISHPDGTGVIWYGLEDGTEDIADTTGKKIAAWKDIVYPEQSQIEAIESVIPDA